MTDLEKDITNKIAAKSKKQIDNHIEYLKIGGEGTGDTVTGIINIKRLKTKVDINGEIL